MSEPRPRRRAIDVGALLTGLLAAVVTIVCVAVIIVNQTTVGWPNLIAMLLALAGLIVLLALYNRRFR